MGIYDKRVALYPQEYPSVVEYRNKIHDSWWSVRTIKFDGDVHDFHCYLNRVEQSNIKRSISLISQVEVDIKTFWVKIGERLQKPEIAEVGAVFGDNEVRHSDAYKEIMRVLGLENEMQEILKHPAVLGRVDYLKKYLNGYSTCTDRRFVMHLALFSIFIENVSLFSQFLIIKSFADKKNVLSKVNGVVQATQKEEQVHALFGAHLIGIIKKENPSWFDEAFYHEVEEACRKSYEAESRLIDWIFEEGEPDFISAKGVKEFIKYRFNQSMDMIEAKPLFQVDHSQLENFSVFIAEMQGVKVNVDQFHKNSTDYAKTEVCIEDLFPSDFLKN